MNKRSGAVVGLAVATALVASACGGGSEQSVSGEGSTAQQKAMQHFQDILTEDGDVTLNYTGTGSGDGVKKFLNKDVDFAGSDSALNAEKGEVEKAKARCGGNAAWHIPLVAGPVAIAYNLEGVSDLVLTPALIAKIFDGKVTKWNAPEIAALNKGKNLPDKAINTVYRSDESGTTDNFTRFLGGTAKSDWSYKHSKTWPNKIGSGQSKSAGVGNAVKATPGSITYVEWGFATENKLNLAQVDFGSGPVALTDKTAAAALEKVSFKDPASKDLVVDTDKLFALKEAGAWPLTLTTYEIVCSKGYEGDTASALKTAFNTALDKGQDGLAEAGYVPLPGSYKAKLKSTIDSLG